MDQHQKEIEDFGKNDDFWIFGYGSLIWKPPPHYDQRVPGYVEGYVRRFWQASEDHRGTPAAPGRVVTLITHSHWSTLDDHHSSAPDERVWGAAYHIPKEHVAAVREYLDLREINGYSIQFAPFHVARPHAQPQPADSELHPGIKRKGPKRDEEQEQQDQQDEAQAPKTLPRAIITATVSAPSTSSLATSPPPPPTGILSSSSISTTITPSHSSPNLPPTLTTLIYIGLPSNPQFKGPQNPDSLARQILRSRGPSGDNREYLYKLEEGLRGLCPEGRSGDEHVSDLVGRCRGFEREEGGGDVGEEVEMDTERQMGGVALHRKGTTEEVEEVEK